MRPTEAGDNEVESGRAEFGEMNPKGNARYTTSLSNRQGQAGNASLELV